MSSGVASHSASGFDLGSDQHSRASSSGHGSSGGNSSSSSMYSLFPAVEKTFRPRITADIERDLRFLGQSRVDALTSPFDMTLVRDRGGLALYELSEKEFFTMKGVATVHAPLQEVMALLRMETTPLMREAMGDVFGTLFLDGVVLFTGERRSPHESLSVNWMALQASKPNLPHRDYVFLRYGDVFEKTAEHGSLYQSNGSGLYVGASIWESIELDGCEPLPASQNVVRLRMRRCGLVVEETSHSDSVRVSLYLSEAHQGRAAVSTLTRSWMTKVVSCVAQLPNVLLTRALAQQSLLDKSQFTKDGPQCVLCSKAFTVLRRKHHCRVCGDVVCSKCSETRSLRQGGVNRDVRVCQQCRQSSTASIRSSNSGSTRLAPSSSTNTLDSVTKPSYNSSQGSFDLGPQFPTSLSDAVSEPRMKTHPVGRAPHGGHHRAASSTSSTTSSELYHPKQVTATSGDMFLLNNGAAKPVSNGSGSEFAQYHEQDRNAAANAAPALTQAEIAQLERAMTVRENTAFAYALSYSSRQAWPKAPVPTNEAARLARVRELHLVDPGQHFQEMVEYAAAELGCQIAAVCFIGDKSGFLMAKVGLEQRELPRNILLDAHVIMAHEPTIILDASEDVRFASNPLVVDGQIRFFAGFPLVSSDGHVVGSLSVADPFARELLPGDKYFFLKNLADVAIRGVEQNTLMSGSITTTSTSSSTSSGNGVRAPPPPAMDFNEAHLTMQELLRTAYTTQCQVRMQVNPLQQE